MQLRIRNSTADDVPAIHAIYAHAVQHGVASFELEAPDQAEMARRRAAVLAGGFPHIVAEDAGRVLGYAYAGPYRPRPAYRFTVENSIYVAPDAQRRGIGRVLLPALTCTVSSSCTTPSRMRPASGFCRLRWITRFSGRAPYTGS